MPYMTEEEYAAQANRPAPFTNPMQQFGSSILELTNPQREIEKMEMTFRSQMIDAKGDIRQLGEPLMNDQGISSVVGQVQSLVNQVTVMSNFEEKDIPMLIDYISDTLARDLMMNRKTYNITNPSARSKISYIAVSTSYVCLKRALNNGERGFWKGSQQDIRQIVDTGQSKGFFGSLMGWGKK